MFILQNVVPTWKNILQYDELIRPFLHPHAQLLKLFYNDFFLHNIHVLFGI